MGIEADKAQREDLARKIDSFKLRSQEMQFERDGYVEAIRSLREQLYGYCPICGVLGDREEMIPNAGDRTIDEMPRQYVCMNSHVYKPKNALPEPPIAILRRLQRICREYADKQGHDLCHWHPDILKAICDAVGVEIPPPELPPEEEFAAACEHYRSEVMYAKPLPEGYREYTPKEFVDLVRGQVVEKSTGMCYWIDSLNVKPQSYFIDPEMKPTGSVLITKSRTHQSRVTLRTLLAEYTWKDGSPCGVKMPGGPS